MKNEPKIKICRAKGCENLFTPTFSTLQKYCSSQCAYNEKKTSTSNTRKPIAKYSKKHGANLKQYSKDRKVFLQKPENKFCFVDGCKRLANTIEHQKGRKGFASEEKRMDDIPLLLDQEFWKPCCLQHNLEFETNPELSKKYQLSQIHNGKKI